MDIILRLKEFYLLETFQLSLYKSQMNSLKNQYVDHAYQRIIELERHHIDFLKETLQQLGAEVPFVPGGMTSLVGKFLGGPILDLTTSVNRYKLGVAVENKAIEMYRVAVMETWEHPDICKRLWHNMIDEEFHLLWFKDNLKHATSLVQTT